MGHKPKGSLILFLLPLFSTSVLLEEKNRGPESKDLTGSPGNLEGAPFEGSRGLNSGTSDMGSGPRRWQASSPW